MTGIREVRFINQAILTNICSRWNEYSGVNDLTCYYDNSYES
jgi:hypothetical protein